MLKESQPQDATNAADFKAIDTPAKRPTIAEIIAKKAAAKAAPVTPAKDTDKPGTIHAAVSLFERANRQTPCGIISIRDFVSQVHDGTHAAAVAKVRQEVARVQASDLTPEQRKQAVNKVKIDLLPAVSLSGTVTSGGRAKAFEEGRFRHSGWLQLDLDAKDMNGASAPATRDQIGADPHILSAALSPTGEGVKAIMRIPVCKTPGEHLAAFLAAESYMLATYGLKIDPATKDATRVCYATHDPQATWNGATVPLPVPEPQELPQRPATVSTAPRQGLILSETHSPREITADDGSAMLAVIPPDPEYSQWLRVSSATWNAFGEEVGTALLKAWSPEKIPGEYAEKFTHRLTEVHAGTLVHIAKEHGWKTARHDSKLSERAGGNETAGERIAFAYMQADQLGGTSEAMDFVEGLLTEGGASVIYGPSNCGKSFWIVDLGVSVASGTAFRDELEVEQGAVIYIALEGAHGARNRIAALTQAGRLKTGAPFFLIFEAVSLLEAGHADRLAETVAKISEETRLPVRLVILDTMARAMAGGDENSGVDMTAAVKSIDAIRAATGAHVAIVHHCGKNEALGARGHSSLRAAVDTEIEVSRRDGETISTVRVTKQRDLQAGEAMPFSLEVVTLGADRRGKPITSCIVRHEDEMMASKPSKTGRPATATPAEILKLLPMPGTTAWQKKAKDELGVSSTAFYALLKRIRADSSAAESEAEGWRLPKVTFGSSRPICP
jgi:hypothetical protein